MIIDARELSFSDAFKELSDAFLQGFARRDEVLIFVHAHDAEKLSLITGFVEILLECSARVMEAGGYYLVQVIQEPIANAC
jgi:hypothetical protein